MFEEKYVILQGDEICVYDTHVKKYKGVCTNPMFYNNNITKKI